MDKAINRQKVLLQHLNPSSFSSNDSSSTSLNASACLAGDSAAYHRTAAFGDDVVIVAAYRTALCKVKRGGFKDTHADDILAPVLKAVIEKTNLNPSEVGDIVVGSVLGAGFYDIGIGAGLESMTTNPMAWDGSVNPRVKMFEQAQNCLLPMGITSENVASRFGVSRKEQDEAAVESHRRAAAATAAGRFKDEIIPVSTKIVDPKTGEEKSVTISVDDGIRPNASVSDLESLSCV
uniref:Thiolase N-terminal domain-containing protein n=1 Tax=Medicago truncatula TaxID=3880 RepID=B7FIU6_MEDTR|nr:unknown [Medicago truncatula]